MFSSSRRTFGFAAASLSAAALAAASIAPTAGAAAGGSPQCSKACSALTSAPVQCSKACSALTTAADAAIFANPINAGRTTKSGTGANKPTSGSKTGLISICSFSFGC
jgi:hypothetical protein